MKVSEKKLSIRLDYASEKSLAELEVVRPQCERLNTPTKIVRRALKALHAEVCDGPRPPKCGHDFAAEFAALCAAD